MNFIIRTRFETFNAALLTGLICSGISAKNSMIFTEDLVQDDGVFIDSRKRNLSATYRISMMKALSSGIDVVKSSIVDYNPRNTGFKLELCAYVAICVASHSHGFKGCIFKIFLENMIRELDFNATYNYQAPEISFHEKFPKEILNLLIPFLSSMATDLWDETAASDLEHLFGAYLGLAFPSIANSPGDFVIQDLDGRNILVGECKLYSAPVAANILKDMAKKKFSNYPDCNLFLAIAPLFTSLPTFYDKSFCAWCLKKEENGFQVLPIKSKKTQPYKAKKHIIVISLQELYSTEDYDSFETLKKKFNLKIDIPSILSTTIGELIQNIKL